MKNWQNVLDAIDEPFLELTDKDRKVAKYLARGWTFEEIHKLTEIPKSTLTTTAARRSRSALARHSAPTAMARAQTAARQTLQKWTRRSSG